CTVGIELSTLLGGAHFFKLERRRVSGIEEGSKRAGEPLRLLPVDEVTAVLEADHLAVLQQGGGGSRLRDGEDTVARSPEEAHGRKLGDVRDSVEEVPRLAPPADDVAHGARERASATGLAQARSQQVDLCLGVTTG